MVNNNTPIPEQMKEVMFEGPVPGQSLTNDPDTRYKWEQPPQFTSLKEAREQVFFSLTDPSKLGSVQTLMSNGVSINTIAETVLVQSFREGKINPDMLLNLMEPTMVILLAIAEKSGIRPIVESDDEGIDFQDTEEGEEEMTPREPLIKDSFETRKLLNNQRRKILTPKTMNTTSLGNDIKKQLDTLNVEKVKQSLLQKDKSKETRKSLLGE